MDRLGEPPSVLAGPLGSVHGGVGLPQQRHRQFETVRRFRPVQGDADTGRHRAACFSQRHRLRQTCNHLLRHGDRAFDLFEIGQNHREFIAAQAGHGIGGAHATLQAFGDFPEQHIAHIVTEGIVHLL